MADFTNEVDLWHEHVTRPIYGPTATCGILCNPRRAARSPDDHGQLDDRLDATRAELSDLRAAAKRVERSTDPRAAKARDTLTVAVATAEERVRFLEGFEAAIAAAEQAHRDAIEADREASFRLQLVEPEDAAAASIAVASSQASVRKTLRVAVELIDRFRTMGKPVLPALREAMDRAVQTQLRIDALREDARSAEALDVAAEPAGTRCPHWAAIVGDRAGRAKGKAA